MEVWLTEKHSEDIALSYRVSKTIFSAVSPYQNIDVIENPQYGRMLLLDGIVMFAEANEFHYSEMISHVPLFVHPRPRRVLIIGGGDGGTAREVLRHPDVERIDLIEIDKMVVETALEHFPSIAETLRDRRVNLTFQDGAEFVRTTEKRYDVAIVDSTDPIGSGEKLFERQFYQNTMKCLKTDGLMVAQSESPLFHPKLISRVMGDLKSLFSIVCLYCAFVPVYQGGMWSFAFASKKYDPRKNFRKDKYDSLQLPLRYYNECIHYGAFWLPTFVKGIAE
ncbi:MAG: polyamine aminopropyltransferase [Proteobacteria bacterium]|nr:polyamine aminopropyltransferase [Pseudomonadota bacterium]